MTASPELIASPRTVIGKSSRRLADAQQIPAVLYGPDREAASVAVDRHDFEVWLSHHGGHGVIELRIEGEKKAVNAMMREIQRSPVKGTIVHVDFLEVSMSKPVTAVTSLHLLNDPEGVRAGGVLTVTLHELNIEALPGDLPESLDHDVSALEMGDTLYVRDIVAPAGVTLLDDPAAVIASVQQPRLEIEEVVEGEVAEPELIGAESSDEE